MGKINGQQTTTSSVDPATANYIRMIMAAARGAGSAQLPGASPYMTNAASSLQQQEQLGLTGSRALAGDSTAVQALMSPYINKVIDTNNAAWQKINQQTQQQVNANATGAGAFGGTRYGVALGNALNANNAAQAQQTAELYQSALNDAMQRAGTLSGQGETAAQGAASLGDAIRNIQISQNPDVQMMNYLKTAFSGLPYGTAQTATSTGGSNPLLGALGGLLTTSKLSGDFWKGPWGQLTGALIGGLGA